MYVVHVYNEKQRTQDGSLQNSCGNTDNIRTSTIIFCILVSIMQVGKKLFKGAMRFGTFKSIDFKKN